MMEESLGGALPLPIGRPSALRRAATQLTILLLVATILIWDLRRVKELSDTIHDDHKGIWRTMNRSSLEKWYTPFDTCLLEKSSHVYVGATHNGGNKKEKVIDMKTLNASCARRSRNAMPSFCIIGSSIGSRCTVSPVQSYFRSQLMDYDLGNPDNQHLLKSLKRLAVLNKPLVFIGDTISRQNFNALICEILRTRQVVMVSSSSGSNNPEASTYFNATFRWKASPLQVSIHFMHLAHVFTRSISAASLRDRAYDHDPRFHPEYSDARIWDRSSTPKIPGSGSTGTNNNNVSLSFRYHKRQSVSGEEIRTSIKLSELCSNLNELLEIYKGLVIVANVGVWYNTRERYRNEILPFVQILSLFGEQNVVFFRETSAQHWNHTAYGYFINGGLPEEGSCQPLRDSSPQLDWRNREIKLAVDSLEHPDSVQIMGFRDLTAPLHDMHPNTDNYVRDCTRFCYFPQMWQTIWRDVDVVTSNSSKLLLRSGPVNVSTVMSRYPEH
jgi:hypothetical protein